jgi:hypothetical protein
VGAPLLGAPQGVVSPVLGPAIACVTAGEAADAAGAEVTAATPRQLAAVMSVVATSRAVLAVLGEVMT